MRRARWVGAAVAAVAVAAGVAPAAGALEEAEVRAAAPVQVAVPVTRSISAGYGTAAVVTADGSVWQWGRSQLSYAPDPSAPLRVRGLVSTASVSVGFVHTAALRSSDPTGRGYAVGWGSNLFGALATPSLREDPVPIPGMADVVDLIGGGEFTFALTAGGSLLAVGNNQFGYLGNGTTENASVPAPVTDLTGAPLTNIVAAAAGIDVAACALALDGDGQVWSWGTGPFCTRFGGGDGTRAAMVPGFGPSNRAVAVAAAGQSQLVLRSDGTVWVWGLTRLPAPSLSSETNPTMVPGLTNVTAISAGSGHTLALRSDGTVWGWGLNYYGALGPGVPEDAFAHAPAQISGIADVTAVAAGGDYSMALKADGTVWTWGLNTSGQLGDGGTTSRPTPQQVPGLPPVAQPGGTILASGLFQPVSPARLVDTRASQPVAAGGTLPVQVGGQGGVAANATAGWLNVTATNEAAPGFLTVYPCDTALPLASNVNYQAGVDVPNAVAAPLSGDGQACVFSQERSDVVVDVNGYFATEGYAFEPVSPSRLVDTRLEGTRLAPGGVLRVPVAGRAGVAADAVAAVLNVTATDAADSGFLTVFPCDQAQPNASNVNYRPAIDSPNAVAAPLAADGSTCIFSLRAVDVVVDVSGYFGTTGSIFNAVVPARLADTRTTTRVAAGTTLQVPVTSRGGVPEGAVAAMLNVTATAAADSGYLTVFPCDQPRPTASNVNYRPGVDTPNAVAAPLAADGSACIFSLRDVDVVVDVNGFFL